MNPMHFAHTEDGMRLAFERWPGDGEPVLLLHGFSNDRRVWTEVAERLPANLAPIACDLRGHGDSDWSLASRYHPRDYAADLRAVLHAAGVERVSLVGHSLGGSVATFFAAMAPECVSRLVLVDTGPSLSNAAWEWAASDVADGARCYETVDAFRAQLDLAYPFGSETALDRLAESSLVARIDGRFEPKMDPALIALDATGGEWAGVETELWAALEKIACPTLILRGERSAMLSEETAIRMSRSALRDASLETIPAAGHAIAIDNAPALADALAGFLAPQKKVAARYAAAADRATGVATA